MWRLGLLISAAAGMILALDYTSALGQDGEDTFPYQTDTGVCIGIENGDRIRISVNSAYGQEISDDLEEGGTLTGKLVSCGDGVLMLKLNHRRSSEDPLAIPVEKVDFIEVSQGRSSHTSAGAGIGLVAGVLVGWSLQREEGPQSEWDFDFTD
jgi:hypothetical protein